jgi:GNAT superfamily N-acetyltransferase
VETGSDDDAQDPHLAAAGLRVRAATPGDAGLLATLGERSFRESWAAYNTAADMDAYCEAHFRVEAIREDLLVAAAHYLVADCEGRPAGYLRWIPAPAPPGVAARSPCEVSRVYVERRWHGRGVGPALMAACLRDAAAAGHDVAWLAVWQRAPRAIAFYRKWGFSIAGTAVFRLGADLQDDFVMWRGLASPTSAGPGGSASPSGDRPASSASGSGP